MDLFTIDTAGEKNLLEKDGYEAEEVQYSTKNEEAVNHSENEHSESEEEEDDDENEESENDETEYDYGGLPPPSVDIINILKNPTLSDKPLYRCESDVAVEKVESDLDVFCKSMGWVRINGMLPAKIRKARRNRRDDDTDYTDVHKDFTKTDVSKEMQQCVLKGIEKKRSIKVLSEREAARERKAEASKSKGKNWFNMPATEVTDELRNDLEIIQMRSVLNPTHFYKKNDLKTLPKYFQVGTVIPSPLDKYSDRGERVTKKKSLVDELLQDAEFQQYNKRKYNEVMAEKKKTGFKKAYKKMKKLKKKS